MYDWSSWGRKNKKGQPLCKGTNKVTRYWGKHTLYPPCAAKVVGGAVRKDHYCVNHQHQN